MAGRYRCGRVLGTGATSTVYEGRDLSTGQTVAIKRIVAEVSAHRDGGDLLRREVGVSERVRHPGLVKVYDAGRDPDGAFFIIMEFLSGETLEERLARGEVDLERGLDVVEAVLEPLGALHEHGVVHRDLKPSNIFLTEDGAVKLLDLGIAKHAQDASVTRTGAGVGTPLYMAPEQAVSARDVKPVADVWSVGALMYRLVAGRLPFEGDNAYEVVLKACTEEPPPITGWAPRVDPMLAALIHRCLIKAPEQRIADAAELAAALRDARAGVCESAALVDPALAALARAATELPGHGEGPTERAYRSIELPRARGPLYLGVFLCMAALGLGAGAFVWTLSEPAGVAPESAAPAERTAPVDVAEPSEPSEPSEPIEPGEPIEPIESIEPPGREALPRAASRRAVPSAGAARPRRASPRRSEADAASMDARTSEPPAADEATGVDAPASEPTAKSETDARGSESSTPPEVIEAEAPSPNADARGSESVETPPIRAMPPRVREDAGVRSAPPPVTSPPPPKKKKPKKPAPFLTF